MQLAAATNAVGSLRHLDCKEFVVPRIPHLQVKMRQTVDAFMNAVGIPHGILTAQFLKPDPGSYPQGSDAVPLAPAQPADNGIAPYHLLFDIPDLFQAGRLWPDGTKSPGQRRTAARECPYGTRAWRRGDRPSGRSVQSPLIIK